MHGIRLAGNSDLISVGKIFCLGQNYAAHAREMQSDIPESPVVFMKPPTAIVHEDGVIVKPVISNELHHEVELVVLITRTGKHIIRERAMDYVGGYGVGLDMTLRDVQRAAKKGGLPWTTAKGFDTSAPLSDFVPKEAVPDPHNLDIRLSVNETVRQHANTREMIFQIDAVIAYLSTIFTIEPGDLIYTGTPEGIGPVHSGDVLRAEIESIGSLTMSVA